MTVKLFAVGAPRGLTPPLPLPATLAGPPILLPLPDGAGEARLGGPTERGAGPTLGGPTLPGPAFDFGAVSSEGAGEIGDKPGLIFVLLPP